MYLQDGLTGELWGAVNRRGGGERSIRNYKYIPDETMYHKVHTDVHNLSFVIIYTLLSAYYKFSLQYYIPVHASEPLVLFYVINSLLYAIEKKCIP